LKGAPKPLFTGEGPGVEYEKLFFFSYISVTVYRIQENCEQNMFSALKNPKENKEKEKEWNKILTVKGGKSS